MCFCDFIFFNIQQLCATFKPEFILFSSINCKFTNDGPFNRSVKIALGAKAKKKEVPECGVFNPFEEMAN